MGIELGAKPVAPPDAECPPVPLGLEAVQHQDAQPFLLDCVLDEAIVDRSVRERGQQPLAAVVVAGDGVDRKGAGLKQLGDLFEAFDIAVVGQVAGQQQHIDLVRGGDQAVQRLPEANAVEFLGARIRIEPDMDIGHLRNQHWPAPPRASTRLPTQ